LKCDVAFPIEGFTLDVKKSFPVEDVIFELYNPEVFYDPNQHLQRHQIKDIRILGVVRAVNGKDTGEVKSSAYQRVDRAVNIVQFLVTDSLRTVDEVYFIKPLDNEGPVKIEDTINNGFRALGQSTFTFSLDGLFSGPKFDAQKYVEEKLKPFGSIDPDMKESLDKALSYYRIAVCAYNPYQAIDSFFAVMQAVVEGHNEKEIKKGRATKEIKQYIKPIITRDRRITEQEFNTKFGRYYGIYRTDGTHGRLHVNDYSKLREASEARYEVAKWTYFVITDFITRPSNA
jgi:hypothetical protein